MKCKKCGEELQGEFAFCPKCGEKVEKIQENKDVENLENEKTVEQEKEEVKEEKKSKGKIIGIVIACIAVIAIAIFACIQFSNTQNQKESVAQRIQRFETCTKKPHFTCESLCNLPSCNLIISVVYYIQKLRKE